MVCCGLAKDNTVGTVPWRIYVLALILMSGLGGILALLVVSALSGLNARLTTWRPSIRAFLVGTIGPRLARFVDKELFTSLARTRCRLSGSLFHRFPRLSAATDRYFNLGLLAGGLAIAMVIVAIGLRVI